MSPDVGVSRQGYFLGKLVKKFKDDIIPNELKSPAGLAAAAVAANYAPKFIPGMDLGGKNQTLLQRFLPSVSGALGTARKAIGIGGSGRAPSTVDENIFDEFGTKGKVYVSVRICVCRTSRPAEWIFASGMRTKGDTAAEQSADVASERVLIADADSSTLLCVQIKLFIEGGMRDSPCLRIRLQPKSESIKNKSVNRIPQLCILLIRVCCRLSS